MEDGGGGYLDEFCEHAWLSRVNIDAGNDCSVGKLDRRSLEGVVDTDDDVAVAS